MLDDYAISADEMDAFLLFAKHATYDAFDIALKMTTGILTEALLINATVTISSTETTGLYGFKILDAGAYNTNNLYTVDDGIKKYIDFHILTAWYDLVGHSEEYTKWLAKRDDART